MIKKKDLSQKDKKVWENFIKDPFDIYDKDIKDQKSSRKDRYKFDLHGFTLEDANKKVREILLSCIESKYKELLLITGKGIHSSNEKDAYVSKDYGKLKHSVPDFIKSNYELSKLIISIREADVKDGGEGAIIVKLKNL